jgi:urease accessory protein
MDTELDVLTWQLIDSAFPAGAFAHSGGLESAIHHGLLQDHESLKALLETMLQQIAISSVPLVLATHRDPPRLPDVDLFCDAFLTNHVANRASRMQGGTFLTAVRQIFTRCEFDDLGLLIRSKKLPGHFSTIFGVIAQSLGLEQTRCGHAFLFIALRGLISAAVRLGATGPLEGQRLQIQLSKRFGLLMDMCKDLSVGEIAQTSPFLDMLQGNQDRLYSRLFQS